MIKLCQQNSVGGVGGWSDPCFYYWRIFHSSQTHCAHCGTLPLKCKLPPYNTILDHPSNHPVHRINLFAMFGNFYNIKIKPKLGGFLSTVDRPFVEGPSYPIYLPNLLAYTKSSCHHNFVLLLPPCGTISYLFPVS